MNAHELDQRLEIIVEIHGNRGTGDGRRVYRGCPGKASEAAKTA
jgi:hypothetical protein